MGKLLSAAVTSLALGTTANVEGQGCEPAWSKLSTGMSVHFPPMTGPFVQAMATYDSGKGPELYAAGHFRNCGSTIVNHIARWDGNNWQPVGGGVLAGTTAIIQDLEVFDSGDGPELYAAGLFSSAGGVGVNNIAKWNGTTWSAVGSPTNGTNGTITALKVFEDGNGPALYVGGAFSSAGGVLTSNIAKWDGSKWSAVGSGVINNTIAAIEVYDDGKGDALYIGGAFTTAGGVIVNRVAKLNGTTWEALGTGVTAPSVAVVHTMVGLESGVSLPTGLYVGGNITAVGGISTAYIGRWTGSEWQPVPTGMNGEVADLAITEQAAFPNGGLTELKLYAAGSFTFAEGVPMQRVAQWDGETWEPLGPGLSMGVPLVIFLHDDGTGNAAYFGGYFKTAGSLVLNSIGRWGYGVTNTPPWITSQPSDVNSHFGEPIAISASAVGSDLSYQWRRNGMDVKDDASISGSMTNTLTVDPAMPNHTGMYDLVVSNTCGKMYSYPSFVTIDTCHSDIAPGFGDTVVSTDDLLVVLNNWGQCLPECPGDVSPTNGNGQVDIDDLIQVILDWGPCD